MEKKLITLLAIMLLGAGCARQSATPILSQPVLTATGTAVPTAPGGTSLSSSLGTTVSLQTTYAQMSKYVVGHPLNSTDINALNPQMSVQLYDDGNGHLSGQVYITYSDNGATYGASNPLTAPDSTLSLSGNMYNGQQKDVFNKWFKWSKGTASKPNDTSDKVLFHGFFQDAYGVIVVVVDQTDDYGDGLGPENLSGRVYYKNFANNSVSQPWIQSQFPCWFNTVGLTVSGTSPTSCSTFRVGNQIVTDSALYPNSADGYQLLGTFNGLTTDAIPYNYSK